MDKRNYSKFILLSVTIVLFCASVGHARSKIKTEEVKSNVKYLIRDSNQNEKSFLRKIKIAIQDLKSK